MLSSLVLGISANGGGGPARDVAQTMLRVPAGWRCRTSQRQRFTGLFLGDVLGVPVRPVRIVLATVPLLVFAVGGGCAAERGGEVGRGGERRAVGGHASGQSRGDFLQQPAVAVGIAERGKRTIGAMLGVRSANSDPPEQIGLVRAGKD